MFAEPLEGFCILICSFIPFGTCGWGSQSHTAIFIVICLYFILIYIKDLIISVFFIWCDLCGALLRTDPHGKSDTELGRS